MHIHEKHVPEQMLLQLMGLVQDGGNDLQCDTEISMCSILIAFPGTSRKPPTKLPNQLSKQ